MTIQKCAPLLAIFFVATTFAGDNTNKYQALLDMVNQGLVANKMNDSVIKAGVRYINYLHNQIKSNPGNTAKIQIQIEKTRIAIGRQLGGFKKIEQDGKNDLRKQYCALKKNPCVQVDAINEGIKIYQNASQNFQNNAKEANELIELFDFLKNEGYNKPSE